MRVLLVATYELGHQPLHLASPAAALRARGHDVRALDLSVEDPDPARLAWAEVVAFSVPMHTAMRLAMAATANLRGVHPTLPVCFYGLYAGVGGDTSLALVDRLLSGEYEPALCDWVDSLAAGRPPRVGVDQVVHLGRHPSPRPARDLLPALERYAKLAADGEERLVGYVEASHGCVHRCRHCPVPTVYDGRIRVVAPEVVVADVAQLVDLGARHITFGDPDFLNGPHHSMRVVRDMHDRFPHLTFDCTVKVEHVLRHADLWAELAGAGCLFVVSAFESVDDEILVRLDKGHTAADAARAVDLLRTHGIEVRPSFLPFTPWTTLDGMVDLVDFVARHDLVGNVDPVQYTIRLLLPEGSLLLDHPDLTPHLGPFDPGRLSYAWAAPDPRVDRLQTELAALVTNELARGQAPGAVHLAVRRAVLAAAGRQDNGFVAPTGPARPRLTEPWFCCAEPTDVQLSALR